jgi:ATP adenylyltransferase
MEYILSPQKPDACIFCPGRDRGGDRERLILYVGPLSMVIMNRYPYINGHLLVAPVKHVADLDGLSQEEALDLLLTVRRSLGALRRAMSPDGFNVGLNLGRVAGAGVEAHVHFHIVPRWNGDTNCMTVLGDVRVIPEHIKATYEKLLPFFQERSSEPGGEP